MQAARYYGRRDVRIEAIDEQYLTPDGVRVDVEWCGICGTDVSQYANGPTAVPTDEPHPVTNATAPITLGHEICGVVTETGSGVDRIDVGDRVVVNPIVPCSTCSYCLDGRYRLCEQFANVGLHGNGGGFAETLVVPASNVSTVPDSVSSACASLVEPLSVSVHAVCQSNFTIGDRVAVFGAGPIGLGIVQAAYAGGAREIFVSEPQDARRELAGRLGANTLLDPTRDDVSERIRAKTELGVDVAFEAAGLQATTSAAIRSTAKGGCVVSVASARDVTIHPTADLVMTERSICGSFAYDCVPYSDRSEFETVLALLADGRLDGEAMISDRISLENLVEDGLNPLADGAGRIKVLVEP